MHIQRRFTKAGQSAYSEIEFRKALSEIKNPDGSVVFRLDDIDVPAQFSQVAADILAQKYFRKAGVPARLKKVEENNVPSFLWRSVPDEAALAELPEAERYGSERDARQVFTRLAGDLQEVAPQHLAHLRASVLLEEKGLDGLAVLAFRQGDEAVLHGGLAPRLCSVPMLEARCRPAASLAR